MAAVLAHRLANWAIANKCISPSQKGFLPFEGCFEHGYQLRAAIEDSKRAQRDLRILWLDLKKAFGSVPHVMMWEMLQRMGVNFIKTHNKLTKRFQSIKIICVCYHASSGVTCVDVFC